MIKAVLLAIPTYAMTCFRVHTSLYRELEAICARFWWESSNQGNNIHWKRWDWLCRKKEDGRLGFTSGLL